MRYHVLEEVNRALQEMGVLDLHTVGSVKGRTSVSHYKRISSVDKGPERFWSALNFIPTNFDLLKHFDVLQVCLLDLGHTNGESEWDVAVSVAAIVTVNNRNRLNGDSAVLIASEMLRVYAEKSTATRVNEPRHVTLVLFG